MEIIDCHVRLSGTSKNGVGQVNPKGRLSEGKVPIYPDCDRPSKIHVAIIEEKFYQWTRRKLIGQVDFFSTCLKKSENFLISTPV